MPTWLSIVIAIIGLISTVLGIFGISAYVNEKAKSKVKKEERKEQEYQEYLAARREEKFRAIIKEEIAPIKKEIKEIKDNTKESLDADILVLRCQIKNIETRCKKQGYADVGDKMTINELKEKYKKLGGNNFKEYVNKWVDTVNNLPDEKPKENK